MMVIDGDEDQSHRSFTKGLVTTTSEYKYKRQQLHDENVNQLNHLH